MEKQVMHGKYVKGIDRELISKEDTFVWLFRGDLKAENESEVIAAQDRA
jgi:hypothetical protein